MQYQRRPELVEAWQVTDQPVKDLPEWVQKELKPRGRMIKGTLPAQYFIMVNFAEIGSETLRLGDWVVNAGNPLTEDLYKYNDAMFHEKFKPEGFAKLDSRAAFERDDFGGSCLT